MRPNLLLLFPDQWRWDFLGCEDSPYGKVPVRTPHIDALAKRGVRLTQCRTNAPLCAPARACLALGVRYERCGVVENGTNTDRDRPNVFRSLREAGYRTMTCGKSDLRTGDNVYADNGYPAWLNEMGFNAAIDQRGKIKGGKVREPGENHGPYMAYLREQGLLETHQRDYARREQETTIATSDWPAPFDREHFTDDFCGRSALKLLDSAPPHTGGDHPWFLWVNFPGPHDPHDAPRELQQRYDSVDFSGPVNGLDHYFEHRGLNHPQLRRNYAASCEGIDEWVGRIVAAVEARGELDNTVVVFASDHGEMLGDHGRWAKAVWHEPSVHVPLIVAGPGVEAGGVSESPVELIDVGATLLDAAGAAAIDGADARSLLPLLRGQTTDHRDLAFSSLLRWRLVTDGRFKLVRTAGEADRLFDLRRDPREERDCAADHPDEARRLAASLDATAGDVTSGDTSIGS